MNKIYDVIILGSGPAGIQAAIHASRKKAAVLMLGRMHKSSLYWAHVENFCCQFRVTGEEMLETGKMQAENFGTEIIEEDVLSIVPEGKHFVLTIESGTSFTARSLILATGTTRNKLGVPGEKELLGKGVSYCVECDGGFFRNEPVAVLGGQSAAVGGAVTLSKLASKVWLVNESFEVAPALLAQAAESGVTLLEGTSVKSILGETAVTGLALKDGNTLNVTGVFIELGAKGVLELAATLGLELDESMKYVQTDKKQRTNIPGVFAAGDICGPPLQIAKAVGEGCVAGIEAATYARKLTTAQTDAELEPEA
ncbi:NAD(P)/FAD-dependent oxidoreductase [Paucidesulfovibrio longus]|uniref:NAD(P)/FAD-dependent oxidoreductase n=1 Tax=Paucidesulfovibrio longus TaxID=889 RepID=UPI0003B74AE6|nr:FAD-dependent oxidoreductase [Paucidesulfovibrio longus]